MLMDKKYRKYLDINNNYQIQIKEMELLISSTGLLHLTIESNDDQHYDAIKDIIKDLKINQQNEIDKNEENHKLLMKESYAKFQQLGFKNNKKIESIEKNFKIGIYMFINSFMKSS